MRRCCQRDACTGARAQDRIPGAAHGHHHAARHRHGQRLPDVSGRAQRHARRCQSHLHRRGRQGHRRRRRVHVQEAHSAGQGGHACRRGAWLSIVCTGANFERGEDALHRHHHHRGRSCQRQYDKFPYTVFSTWVSSQPTHALGQWACEQGYKRVSAIGTDYAFGYEQVGGFQKAFEDCGGKVVQKNWVPFGTKDFGPYIPGIKSDIDAIFSLMVGPMALQFPKQLRASGNKTIILGGSTNYDEFALPFMGDEVIADVSAHVYSAALQTPANEAFVKKYRAKYGKVPSYYSEANYATAMWIDQTLAKFKGKYPGPVEFIKTMASIEINPPRGPVRLDLATKSPIQNIYVKKVEKKKMFDYDK